MTNTNKSGWKLYKFSVTLKNRKLDWERFAPSPDKAFKDMWEICKKEFCEEFVSLSIFFDGSVTTIAAN